MTNESFLKFFNEKSGIFEAERAAVLNLLFRKAGLPVQKLLDRSIASMNQDVSAAWPQLKPPRPEISFGKIPERWDDQVDTIGVGGMFAYLNLLAHASRNHASPNRSKYCIVTNPYDTFTFSAWTLHPEEDMDQRLVPMFRTRSLAIAEMLRLLGFSKKPDHPHYKAFRIDYPALLKTIRYYPGEFMKFVGVNAEYVIGELQGAERRYAEVNLERNRATVRTLEELGLIGEDPERHMIDMGGRIVFELPDEPVLPMKRWLKEKYRLMGTRMSAREVAGRFGDEIGVLDPVRTGRLLAILYKGGHFWPGFKANALAAARGLGIRVLDEATATRIVIDAESEKCAVSVSGRGGNETIVAGTALMAIGDYSRRIVPVDGVSTLFAIRTEKPAYRLFPSGMGEGGTIHIVPVCTVEDTTGETTHYYHLGKATNGAVVGRSPNLPKRVYPDRGLISHLAINLNSLLPRDGRLIWLTFTECGRPVTAIQGYRLDTWGGRRPVVYEALGGCGLGGNTPVLPEVQDALESRTAGKPRTSEMMR